MSEQEIVKLLQDRQNEFIEKRTIIETEVNKFLKSLENQDEDIKQKCGTKDGVTARDLLPALWLEPFNEEEYKKQREALDTYIAQVSAVCDQLNQEAAACLQA
jgi:hypothetical protein